jgi:hypothetical protein
VCHVGRVVLDPLLPSSKGLYIVGLWRGAGHVADFILVCAGPWKKDVDVSTSEKFRYPSFRLYSNDGKYLDNFREYLSPGAVFDEKGSH